MGIHDGHREKMRRRFLETGLEGFADHEALELLLYYAIPRRDTNPIAHALMERYGSLSGVMAAPIEDLQKVKGIGENAAILLNGAPAVPQGSSGRCPPSGAGPQHRRPGGGLSDGALCWGNP